MKKLLLIILFTTITFAKIDVVVSIVPQKVFVNKIGGEQVAVTVMVQNGVSPHTYTPKPSQMKKLSKAKLYLSIGVEFEEVWLSKFMNQNRAMLIFDTSVNIKKTTPDGKTYPMCKSLHHHEGEEELDPHVWVDPINVKVIAQNIYEALVKVDKANESYYKKNLERFLKEIDKIDQNIKTLLKETPKETTFMVFHPAWGYFAKRYGLKQLAVEVEGKSPKMKALVKIIEKAKKESVQAIFTQPEFSDRASQTISKQLHIKVVKASTLAEDWGENLVNLAKAIVHKEP